MATGRKYKWNGASARVAVAGLLLATVAACGDDGETSETGGTITMATWSATQSLDPVQVAGTGNSGGAELAALYDTIMRYDPDGGTFEPNTAESLTPNDDFTQWTLTLRSGITFSDGAPYDSAAVVANLQRHTEARSNASSLVAPITDYATPDDRTVVFTLAFPWNNFPFALAGTPGMVVNPAAVAEQGDAFGTNPVGGGAGPFILDEFRADESLTLTRNPDYWGGEVPLDGVRFIHAGDGPQTYEAFRAGSVDLAFLRDAGAIADAEADGAAGIRVQYSANDTMIMNNGFPITCQEGEPAPRCDGQPDGTQLESTAPTADKRVRQAVAAAIDPETLKQRVYGGAGSMSSALISEESRWYDGVEGPAYDIDRARELVEQVKADGWDGRIRVSCHTGLPTWGTAVQGMLEAAGMQVELTDQQEIAANTSAVIVRKDFDLACFGSSISDAEPFFALNRDFNSTYVTTGGGNFSGYVNPTVDEAIAAGRAAGSEAEVKAAITTIARAYAEDAPFLALTAQPEVVLISEEVGDVLQSVNTVMLLGKATRG
ncbi:ABC transporter substrate-binding protein [Micromonospora sp. NBC_01813]|uniref:ABC transporter substrate-binding protein n=1 Tax=Micromonospora sp. NBC_01813 TaxID=2975988 RepID=UPI002DDA36BF|nr:ABC transporter substrate-binding protein [Micromonospora sp. NBC_01813]WSA10079.1 ABC transporter substrate-binding protein [Micromonospora sp. NBC_01813]